MRGHAIDQGVIVLRSGLFAEKQRFNLSWSAKAVSAVFISKWCKHPDNELTDTLTRLFPQFWLEKRNPSLERITEWKKKEKLIKVAGGRKHK